VDKFKEQMVEEGFFDAVSAGVKEGLKAFKKKRQEDKHKTVKTEIEEKIMSATGKELETLIIKIVDNGYSIKVGKVRKEDKPQRISDWLREARCITTKTAFL